MNYSASELVKRSAAQLLYLRTHNNIQQTMTQRAIMGEEYQHNYVSSERSCNDTVYEEMAGCYRSGGDTIFFSVDMVKNGTCYEIKSVSNDIPLEDWYLKSSVLQCAFYKSLIANMNTNILRTAKFMLRNGSPYKEVYVDRQRPYHLILGNVGEWQVDIVNDGVILDFYLNKIAHLDSYDSARKFDSMYKHREYEALSRYIKLKIIV